MSYWVEFKNHKPGCVVYPYDDKEAIEHDKAGGQYIDRERARERIGRIAAEATGEEPVAIHVLPYAAAPFIGDRREMAFCYSPEQCKGHSSCPKRRACSE